MSSKTTYVALLRAVNVGGRTAKMERVRDLFEQAGCTDVRSYIQSGNVCFRTTRGRKGARAAIEASLADGLGFDVPVVLRTRAEIAHAIGLDAFAGVCVTPDTRLCIVFVAEPLPRGLKFPIVSPKGDVEVLGATDGEAFVVITNPPGRAANPAAFLEKTFQVPSTTRFLHTTEKILAAFAD